MSVASLYYRQYIRGYRWKCPTDYTPPKPKRTYIKKAEKFFGCEIKIEAKYV